ncbi:hypothetical protein Tco_0819428 [Tanacetum coccineum]|uniref:Uncharacterized protein n=1 Tax=Tanacetum coccineum TaxID=301880 RepID=A0ABQ5AAX1_9ASTR
MMQIVCGDGVANTKRRRQDVRGDGVTDLVTASEHSRPKETLEIQDKDDHSTCARNYVSGPEYPEYLAPSDEEVPVEDQPYVVADSPIALSSGYVNDSDLEEDLEEDSEDGPVDYPADGGDDDDDDSSDDDEEEEEEEASEEEEAEEEEEHLALTDFVVAPVVDHVPSFE